MPTVSEMIEFEWGTKTGKGGTKKNVQFYESFTYAGLRYSLYDSVYLFKDGEADPYIGKIIKIWELANKSKKVKVLWFFRPSEISNYLGGLEILKNELFLGTGVGTSGSGLDNINPLEAIAGKCNVVCISKDERNRQPSPEELTMADYLFCRTFDVDKFTISDKLGEYISKVNVRSLLNKDKSAEVSNDHGLKTSSSPSNVNDIGSLDGRPSKKLSDDCSRSALKLPVSDGKCNLKELSRPAEVSNDKQNNECNKDSHAVKFADDHLDERPLKKLKPAKDSHAVKFADDHLDERPLKKLKPAEPVGAGGKTKAPPSNALDGDSKLKRPVKDSNGANASLDKMKIVDIDKPAEPVGAGGKTKAPPSNALDGDCKLKRPVKDSNGANASLDKMKIVDIDKSHLAPSKQSSKKDARVYGRVVEVTRRPDADSSKWFTGLPWEDTMKAAQEEGTLVLLQNLDPTYTSSEIEDIVWHSFREHCTAKVLHCAAISSLHSGQAFVIFRTKQAAVRAVQQLEEGCLMLPNYRPILGHVAVGHLPGKSSSFPGHLFIDRIKFPMQKDKREAVSTSHSSQPNTLEYDMAMEWRLLQERSELMRRNLLKKQGEELRKLRGNLKGKL